MHSDFKILSWFKPGRWTSLFLALLMLSSFSASRVMAESEKENSSSQKTEESAQEDSQPNLPGLEKLLGQQDSSSLPDPTNLEGLGNRRSIVVNGQYYEIDGAGNIRLNTYLNDSAKKIEQKKSHPDYGQLAMQIISPDITLRPVLEAEGTLDENRLHALEIYRTVGTDLKTLYDWTASQIEYVKEETYWALSDYGRQGFLEKKGNCLAYSAVFYYLASGLGYNARVVRGNVLSDSGSLHEHAWVLINERGKDYLYDPQGERELGTGKDFYHIELDQTPIHYVYPEGEEPMQNRVLG